MKIIDDELEDRVVAHIVARLDVMTDALRELVALPTGPSERAGQRACLDLLAKRWRRLGFRTETLESPAGLGHLLAHCESTTPDAPRVLLLGHFDTVFDEASGFVGMARAGDWLTGPGVADMKGGLVVAHAVVEGLRAAGRMGDFEWIVLFTADEEIGSPTSRAIVERTASGCDLVLVFEPGREGCAVVDARAGVGAYGFAVHGVAGHAGVDPAAGRNAIHAAADLITALSAVAAPDLGTLVAVGTISGGTKRNVVPELCRFEVDVRVLQPSEVSRVDVELRALAARIATAHDLRIEVSGRMHRPPWQRDPRNGLVGHFKAVAKDLGLPLVAVQTGGGSDANFTAALGIPTLDGLGPVGEGTHSPLERIDRGSLAERAKLVALALLRYKHTPSARA